MLHARGIVALPDFVANSGGVHLYESVAGLSAGAALERIEELVGAATARVLADADEDGNDTDGRSARRRAKLARRAVPVEATRGRRALRGP